MKKIDEIAAALDTTDLEALRAKRLPPEPVSKKEPPFMTWREIGTLALAWLAITTLLFALDLLEMRGITTYIGLANLTTPLLMFAFIVWYAIRRTQGVKFVDRRGVGIYALVCVALFLLFALTWRYFIYLWIDGADKLFGLEYAEFDFRGAWYDRINAYIEPWSPRWILYWFLRLRFFDVGPFFALVLGYVIYPFTKLLRIWRNHKEKRATNCKAASQKKKHVKFIWM